MDEGDMMRNFRWLLLPILILPLVLCPIGISASQQNETQTTATFYAVDPEATFYPDAHPETKSVDGYLCRDVDDTTWSAVRDGGGTDAFDEILGNGIEIISGVASNTWYLLSRATILFDTSDLPDNCTIISAELSLYGYEKWDDLNASPNIKVYSSNPTSNSALVPGDFINFGVTALCNSPITYDNWLTTGYNDFTLNASGLAAISKTEITKFGIRNANYDVADTEPPWVSNCGFWFGFYQAEKGTNFKPKLVVNYVENGGGNGGNGGNGGGNGNGDGGSCPTGLLASPISSAEIALTWTQDATYTTTGVFYKMTGFPSSPTDPNARMIYKGNNVTFTHKNLTPGTSYFYKVWSWTGSDWYTECYDVDFATTLMLVGESEMLPEPPEQPTEFYREGEVEHLPGAKLVNTLLDSAGIPHDLFWIPFCFGLAAVAAILGYRFLKSMLFIAIIGGTVILFFSLTGVIPLWTLFIYSIIAAGVLVSERVFGW